MARSVNAGMRYSLKFDRSWIVISSDDETKVDEPLVIKKELSTLYPKENDAVFLKPPGVYHSFPGSFGRESHLGQLLRSFIQYRNIDSYRIMKRFDVHSWLLLPDFNLVFPDRGLESVECRRPILLKFFLAIYTPFVRNKFDTIQMRCMGILSGDYARACSGKVTDETSINSSGDIEVSIKLEKAHRFDFINYRIKFTVGTSLGNGRLRKLRDLSG